MEDYLLIFRTDMVAAETQPTAEQMQAMMRPWQDWMGGIAAQNKLVSTGSRLASAGKVVKPNNIVTNGPYVEIKEGIGGYIVIKAESLDEAAEISKGCPILQIGGSVEVRAMLGMD